MKDHKIYDATVDDYSKTVFIDASPDIIYNLLTTPENIQSWWRNPVSGSTKHGEKLRFGFKNSEDFAIMEVEVAEFNSEILWRVLQDTYNSEWIGTAIQFLIKRHDTKTKLHFRHIGLTPNLKSYQDSSKGWDRIIDNLAKESEASGEQDKGL